MEKINRILKGVHQDNDLRFQPEDTMRDSVNGTIISVGNNRFSWKPIGSTELLFELNDYEKIMGFARIRTRYILLTLNTDSGLTRFLELEYDINFNVTVVELSTKAGNPLNLNTSFPIRRMIGFYETDKIQRIYFTDFNNQPRVVNIGEGPFVFNEKFADFFPVLEHVYGTFSFLNIVAGGNLPAGNHFFCWQYYTKDGYYTDWSYLSNPVQLTGDNPQSTELFEYQRMQGQSPDANTRKSILIKISEIDTDYDSIRVAAFYSNDLNSAQPGIVFFDSDISGSEMEILYRGGENIDTILIDDLVNHSTVIEKVKEMTFIKKRNVISVMKERDELDVSAMHSLGKNNQMEVQVTHEHYEIPLDIVGESYTGTVNNEKALFVSPHVTADKAMPFGKLRAGVWYKVTSIAGLTWQDVDLAVHNEAYQDRFKPAKPGTVTAGTFVPIIRKKLYKIYTSIPAAPTGLVLTRQIQQIRLRWNDNSSKEDGFYVYYRVVGAGVWSGPIDIAVPNTEEYIFAALDHTIEYEFYVTAYNADGESAGTLVESARSLPALPAAPSLLTASINQVDKVVLAWQDNSSNEDGFILEYRKKTIGNILPWQVSPVVIGPNIETIEFNATTLNPDPPSNSFGYFTFEFRLKSYNESGSILGPLGYSNTAEGYALVPAPTAAPVPINLYQNGNCLGVTVYYGAVPRATGYVIERHNGVSWDVIQPNFPGLSYYDEDFINEHGLIAQYRVKGKNAQGEGPYSSTVFVYVSCVTGGGEEMEM